MKTVETANKAIESKNGVNNTDVKAAETKAAARVTNGKGAAANGKTAKTNGKAAAPHTPETAKVVESVQKPEPTKAELREMLADLPPSKNLDETIKWVENLHRKKLQRDKLIATIEELDAFEIEQLDETEEAGVDHFQGCQLSIEDDHGGEFSTKNPFLINAVTRYVKSLCDDKLAEIEGEIRFPQ
ncbi:hypothetical protein [Parapedobacter koreensis]|uniref:Uncharacterized protein n=1 Tax=Parapedobacter koreensis TaxID=332977 RepID=A0A1H7FFX1_9SPHI|nr:hypothetical protein [Parapedobacter koreensis]SEK23322.1 hypothetical protein SAMN05421740_101292 [Parapedobacter koreensis]